MIKAIIIDDEKNAIDALQDVLANVEQVEVVGTFMNPNHALEHLSELTRHVVFLDMEMPGIQGLEMARRILALDCAHHIVFVTAYDQYAVEAFEVDAMDYLLKPVRPGRMAKTIEKLKSAFNIVKQLDTPSNEGRMNCFGAFQLLVGPQQWKQVKWRTSKAKELFAYLAHHRGESVHKEKIVEDVWPEMGVARATTYLHTCIYQIRKTIKQHGLDQRVTVEYSHDSYDLTMDGISCDIDEFSHAVSSASEMTQVNIQLYERAATLYRGHYLEVNDYRWAAGFKQQLFMYYTKMMKAMSAYYMQQGMYTEAVLRLQELIAKGSLQEDCHDMLLICYAELEDRAALSTHFEYMNKVYLEEVGIEVRPSTQALYEELYARLK